MPTRERCTANIGRHFQRVPATNIVGNVQEDLERQSYALKQAMRRCPDTRAGKDAYWQHTERHARIEEDQRLVRPSLSTSQWGAPQRHHYICTHAHTLR